jgi:aspartyl-tRNA(Asn)/glutamyl-tRNA(Gln) amidotransferase subunit A
VTNELFLKTISEISPLIESKKVSPVELTKSIFARIEKLDKEINSYITMTQESALAAAKEAERKLQAGEYRGKLHGIPLALKDIFYFKNETVTMGSKIHKDYVPTEDATVVKRLKAAGALFTGKLNMHEYACGGTTNNEHFGACRNPWNQEKIPGGSSGGSAAAVAADLTFGSLGTDTAGSIRMPAAACGTIGLKPTYGLVSTYGAFPLAWSLDHVGPITKSVEDAAILLDAIVGPDSKDPNSISSDDGNYFESLDPDVKGKVIGIEEDFYFNLVDDGIARLVKDSIEKLQLLGAKIEVVRMPHLKYAPFAELTTFASEGGVIHQKNLIKRASDFGSDVGTVLKAAQFISAGDYIQAQQIRQLIKEDFEGAFKQVDFLIAPTLPMATPNIGQQTATINGVERNVDEDILRLTCPTNLTGLPSISVPCGFMNEMPVGLQIIGKAFSEKEILNAAYALEQEQPLKKSPVSI